LAVGAGFGRSADADASAGAVAGPDVGGGADADVGRPDGEDASGSGFGTRCGGAEDFGDAVGAAVGAGLGAGLRGFGGGAFPPGRGGGACFPPGRGAIVGENAGAAGVGTKEEAYELVTVQDAYDAGNGPFGASPGALAASPGCRFAARRSATVGAYVGTALETKRRVLVGSLGSMPAGSASLKAVGSAGLDGPGSV